MKKLNTLLLIFFVSISLINAQVVVTINLTDIAGVPLENVTVDLEASLCSTSDLYNSSGITNSDGNWTDSFQGCYEGYIKASVNCAIGGPKFKFSSYGSNNDSVTINLTCFSPCNGNVQYIQGPMFKEYDFQTNATLPITDYLWDFGDGTSSTESMPTHTFAEAGSYEVYLTTNGDAGTCVYSRSLLVPVCIADFMAVQDENDHLTINMTSNISGGTAPLSYVWDFDDGNTSTEANPTHTYLEGAYYDINLTVTDSTGEVCSNSFWTEAGPVYPLDSCLNWDMIDPITVVCDSIFNPICGCDGVTYNNECEAANFYGVTAWTQGACAGGGNGGGGHPTDSSCSDMTVDFTYTSTGFLSYEFFGTAQGGIDSFDYHWSFGDEKEYEYSNIHGETVSYTFPHNGIGIDDYLAYTVCLTADTSGCTAVACETIVIAVDPFGDLSGVISEAANATVDGDVEKSGSDDPMEGVEVLLLSTLGTQIATSTTNAQGEYGFDNLNFGDYIIKVNINGILHEGERFKLTPSVPIVPNADFNVTETGVVTVGIQDGMELINSFSITPNPAHDRLKISIGMRENTAVQLSVTNLLGQRVVTEDLLLNKGQQTLNLNLRGYATGIYLVSLRSGKELITKKIVKE